MRRAARFALLLGAALGCDAPDRAAGPGAGGSLGRLAVRAAVAGTPVRALAVEVTAADIPSAVIANLALADGVASGAVTVPAGSARTVTLHAYDAGGTETHRGARTVDVAAGANNLPVSITLIPLAGALPIQAVIGSAIVTVSPAESGALVPGQTLQLTVTVTGDDGTPVASPAIRWATLDAAVATVDDAGLVTVRGAGSVQVVALYGNFAGAATVTVSP